MRTPQAQREVIADLLASRKWNYSDLHRETGINYKRLLREAKTGTQPLRLYDLDLIANALGVNLLFITHGEDEAQ